MATSPTDPLAFLNGQAIPFSTARLPIYDLGVMQGATITERLRTVRHQPYLVEEHLDRLQRSLARVNWEVPAHSSALTGMINELAHVNTQWIGRDEDLSIVIFITAGQSLGDANGMISASQPTVCLYSSPLPLEKWALAHREGIHLVTPEVRQLPADVIDPQIKHRSRLHWSLADQQAHRTDSLAMALLLDHRGYVTETSSGNLFIVRAGELLTPRAETTLAGIAQAHLMQLANRLGIHLRRADLTPDEIAVAEEAFLTSSTYCQLPVRMINGKRIGSHVPGPVTKTLMQTWSQQLGLDFAEQSIAASRAD